MNRTAIIVAISAFLFGGTVVAQTRAQLRRPLDATTITQVCVVTDKHTDAGGNIVVDGAHIEAIADFPSTVAGEPTERFPYAQTLNGAGRTCFAGCFNTHVAAGMRSAAGVN